MFPSNLLQPTYPDPENRRRLIARSEVERRGEYITSLHCQLGERHPLVELVTQCLDNDPEYRPTADVVLQQLEGVVIDDPYQYLTKLDLMQLVQQQKNHEIEEQVQRLQAQLRQMEVNINIHTKHVVTRYRNCVLFIMYRWTFVRKQLRKRLPFRRKR